MSARESAIGISVPELADLIDHWRVPSVAAAALGVPPHITLLYPWRPAPLHISDLAEAASAVAGVAPFTLTFRRLGRFPGVLFLHPEPGIILRDVMWRLAAAFPDTPLYGGQFADAVPHLTVAQAATEDALAGIETEVTAHLASHVPIEVTVRELAVMEESEDRQWTHRSTIRLG